MLRKFRIGPRLIFLIVIQTFVLIGIGVTALTGLNAAGESTNKLNQNVSISTRLSYMDALVREDLLNTVHRTNTGALIWSEANNRLSKAKTDFETQWQDLSIGLSTQQKESINKALNPHLLGLLDAFNEVGRLFKAEDRINLSLFVLNDLDELVAPFLNALITSTSQRQMESENLFENAVVNNIRSLQISILVIIAGMLFAGIIGTLIYRSIAQPIDQIAYTVRRVSEGDYEARTGIEGEDEFGDLGEAFDELLEDKVTSLVQTEEENDRLNDSILTLLESIERIGQRDLTVSVPVRNDITGPVADSINLMIEETVKVLSRVSQIAHQVGNASTMVNETASSVNTTANTQRLEVESTANKLASAAEELQRIAKIATQCDEAAEQTTKTTGAAMNTVTETLKGMTQIRESIQETGKRIKRLGERSNEITTIVDIINTIAERTHVLALNASMQAAAAGEAGRGFTVVANEVQRLAESSREATAKISDLVKNIQVDTHDAVVTVDETIRQVVDGSRMAESTGKQMADTQEITTRLVSSVKQIAAGSEQQARISNELRDSADGIVQSTNATAKKLVEQAQGTRNLVKYATELLSSVQVFNLPKGTEAQLPEIIDTVDTVDALDTLDALDTVDTVDAVDTLDALDKLVPANKI